VAATSKLPGFPDGLVHVEETVKRIDELIDTMAARMRERILRVGESDPVSQDALIEASDELEKQAWMLRAQLERCHRPVGDGRAPPTGNIQEVTVGPYSGRSRRLRCAQMSGMVHFRA
jgi:hypothetical protein